MASKYIEQQLLHLQDLSKTTLIDIQKTYQPQIIDIMRLVSKKVGECASKYKTISDIQECQSSVIAIQTAHYNAEATIVNNSVGDYGGCIIKAHKLYELTGMSSIFDKYTNNCFRKFKDEMNIKMQSLIDEDLKVLQTMK